MRLLTRVRRPSMRIDDVRRALTLFNVNAGLRLWYDSFAGITGFIFVGYALALGVHKEKIGYLAAIASLACLVQLAGLLAVNAIRDKKRAAILVGYLEPAFYMGMVVAVYFAPPPLRFPLIALGVLLTSVAFHLVKPTMDEWLASSIPQHIRGRYLGRRMQIVSIISIVVMLMMGFAAERMKGEGALGYGALLLAGGVFGLLAVQALWRVTMPAISTDARLSWSSAPEVLGHWPFLRVVIATTIYDLPFWLASPYYQVYHLTKLHLGEQAISYIMVGYFIIKIISLPFAGRWIDRIGARRMVYLISPLYLLFFVLYVVSSAAHPWPVFVGWAMIGVAEAGFGVAATAALYGAIPDTPARPAYFAFYNLVIFLFAALGAAVGAWTVGKLEHITLTLGPLRLEQFQILFGISFLMLVVCVFGTQLYPGKTKPARAEKRRALQE